MQGERFRFLGQWQYSKLSFRHLRDDKISRVRITGLLLVSRLIAAMQSESAAKLNDRMGLPMRRVRRNPSPRSMSCLPSTRTEAGIVNTTTELDGLL